MSTEKEGQAEAQTSNVECRTVSLPAENIDLEEGSRVGTSLIITVVAIASVYMAQMVQILGAGFLGQSIAATLGGQDKVVWLTLVITFYPTMLGPAVAQAADSWGRKWLIIATAYISVIGCIVVSRSTSIGMAIGGQVIAATSNSTQAILHAVVSEVLPRKYRPMAQAAMNTACGIGGLLGLYIGGALCRSNSDGWRSFMYMVTVFYFVAATALIFAYQPKMRPEQRRPFPEKIKSLDLPGMALLLISLLTFCIGLSYSENPFPWTNARVLAPFLVGVATMAALVLYVVFYKNDGIVHNDLYKKSRNFALAQGGILFEGMSFLAVNNFFAFQISVLYGQDLFQTGLIFSVTWYSYMAFANLTGIYCSKQRSARVPAMTAFVLIVIFFILMSTTNSRTPLSHLWGYPVFAGAGLGIILNVLVVVAQLSTPSHLISTATGLVIATRALGATIGLAVYNAIFNSTMTSHLVSSILRTVIPLGLPEDSRLDFIQALMSGDQKILATIPGVTPEIVQAGVGAMMNAYALSFRNVYICAACFSFAGLTIVSFIKDPKEEFTAHIDAPVNKVTFALRHHKHHQ